jgi:nitrogen fixation NifU-like protein
MDQRELYKTYLRDHYQHPRNYGTLTNPDITSGLVSPSCGDSISIYAYVMDDRVHDIRFTGEGSVLSQATASLLTEHVIGMQLSDILAMGESDIKTLIGLDLGPNRLRTAMIPLHALQKGVTHYVESRSNNS